MWRYVSYSEQKLTAAFVGQCDSVFTEVTEIELRFRFLELQALMLGRGAAPQIDLFRGRVHAVAPWGGRSFTVKYIKSYPVFPDLSNLTLFRDQGTANARISARVSLSIGSLSIFPYSAGDFSLKMD